MTPKRNGSRIAIDYELVGKIALLNPSNDEMAWALGISRATWYRRQQDDEQLRETLAVGQHGRRLSIKRMQWKAAEKGNTALLIWLGKQELGQREPDKIQPQAIQADYKVEEIQAAALAQVADFLQQAADQGRSIEEVIGQVKSNADRIKATTEGDPKPPATDPRRGVQYPGRG